MAYRPSKDDLRIFRAAILAALEGDTDEWDSLTGDEIDRAQELLDELEVETQRDADETDESIESEPAYEDEDDEEYLRDRRKDEDDD